MKLFFFFILMFSFFFLGSVPLSFALGIAVSPDTLKFGAGENQKQLFVFNPNNEPIEAVLALAKEDGSIAFIRTMRLQPESSKKVVIQLNASYVFIADYRNSINVVFHPLNKKEFSINPSASIPIGVYGKSNQIEGLPQAETATDNAFFSEKLKKSAIIMACVIIIGIFAYVMLWY